MHTHGNLADLVSGLNPEIRLLVLEAVEACRAWNEAPSEANNAARKKANAEAGGALVAAMGTRARNTSGQMLAVINDVETSDKWILQLSGTGGAWTFAVLPVVCHDESFTHGGDQLDLGADRVSMLDFAAKRVPSLDVTL